MYVALLQKWVKLDQMRTVAQFLLFIYIKKKTNKPVLVVLCLPLEALLCAEGLLGLGALKSVNFLVLLQSLV